MRIATALAAILLVVSCANRGQKALRVGVTPGPGGEILSEALPALKKQGLNLELVNFTDYIQPNLALSVGDLDANFYQNEPFLKHFNSSRGTKLVAVKKVYTPPMGIYAGRTKSLAALPDRATISVANDPVNLGRGLQLLQSAGLISLRPNVGTEATPADITVNRKHFIIRELEAAQLPRSLPDVDISVINANYALDAGMNPLTGSLFHEKDASPYANILATVESNKDDPRLQVLAAALTSPSIKSFIQSHYKGAVTPAF